MTPVLAGHATVNTTARGADALFGNEYIERLAILARDKALEYRTAKPFPHIYLDNFLPSETAEAALSDFPDLRQVAWTKFKEPSQRKLSFNAIETLPPPLRNVMYFLNSPPVLTFLELLTGIKDLISDPYYAGAGLHQIQRGGNLEIHADFNCHPRFTLDRHINLLVYLNKDWKEEYGGHLELWNTEMTAAEKKILPVFNRCAIFTTTSTTYHGHPTPLSCPPNRTRKSLATYYYSVGRPEQGAHEPHPSVFQRRPGAVVRTSLKQVVIALTPPVLLNMAKKLRRQGSSSRFVKKRFPRQSDDAWRGAGR